MKGRALASCGGAHGAAAVPAEAGGVKWGQWGRAFLITSTARARGTCIPGFEAAAAHAYACRRKARACAGPRGPGFAAGAVISADAVLMPVPVGAGLLAMVPPGVLRSAGGSPWPGPQRLGAALKQLFILEFDRRNAS